MRLTGNTILITGGTSGVGRALALALHGRGNRVIVTGRRRHLLNEIAAACPGLIALPLDPENPRDLDLLAARVSQLFPELDMLVHAAGIGRHQELAGRIAVADPRAVFQANVLGVIQLTAALLPTLKRRSRAAVVTMAPDPAFAEVAGHAFHIASQEFLRGWRNSLRQELGRTRVEILELVLPPDLPAELDLATLFTAPADTRRIEAIRRADPAFRRPDSYAA